MNKTIFVTGIVFGFFAVALGAFAAHGLGQVLDAREVGVFETGVRYQMYHALFLMVLGAVTPLPPKGKRPVFWLIVVGIVFFSGSLYLLATNGLSDFFDFKKIGLITPIGGVLLLTGWAVAGWNVHRYFVQSGSR